jgi:hypothetical protein
VSSDGTPAGIIAPLFPNNSYNIYTPKADHCQPGNYARYALAIEEVVDIAGGIKRLGLSL